MARQPDRCCCDIPGLCRHARQIAETAAAEGRTPARRDGIRPARTT